MIFRSSSCYLWSFLTTPTQLFRDDCKCCHQSLNQQLYVDADLNYHKLYYNASYRDPSECSYSDDNLAIFNTGVIGCENEYDPEIFTGGLEEFLAFVQNTTDGIECYNAFSNGATFAS